MTPSSNYSVVISTTSGPEGAAIKPFSRGRIPCRTGVAGLRTRRWQSLEGRFQVPTWTEQQRLGREGRLSNPVQRRLTDTEIDDLVARYEAGSTIEILASKFGVHRTTVMDHLRRRAVPRRTPRKLTDQMVADAAHRYSSGETLAGVAEQLGIAPSTITRELRLAGIPIRRRGRPVAD